MFPTHMVSRIEFLSLPTHTKNTNKHDNTKCFDNFEWTFNSLVKFLNKFAGLWGARPCRKAIACNYYIVWHRWTNLGRNCAAIFANDFHFGSRSFANSCRKFQRFVLHLSWHMLPKQNILNFCDLQVAVPPWPIYRRKPLNWQKPKNIDGDDSKKKKK